MKLTIIGSSGSMSGPASPASCYLLQAEGLDQATGETRAWSVLFDLGPGSFGALWNHLDPRDLDAVIFSHGHADHIADIISLEVHHRWHPTGPVDPLLIFGPAGIAERAQQIDGWATAEDFQGIFDFQVASAGQAFSVGPLTMTPFEGRHNVPSFGYRVSGPAEVDGASKTFAYTGDTDACDSIVSMATGVDLLLSEAAFTKNDAVRGIHLDGERAGTLASQAQVGALVLTHIQPWTDPDQVLADARTVWDGDISLAVAGEHHVL